MPYKLDAVQQVLRLRAPQTPPGPTPAFPPHTTRAFQTSKQQRQNIPFTRKCHQNKLCFPLLSKEQKHSRRMSLQVSCHWWRGRELPCQHLPGREVVPDPRGAGRWADTGPRTHVLCASLSLETATMAREGPSRQDTGEGATGSEHFGGKRYS